MNRFRMIVIATITAAGLAVGAAPTIAAVAQARASHPATFSTATSITQARGQRLGGPMIPDSHCTRGGVEVTIYKANCTDATGLDSHCPPASGKMPFSPVYIFNGCGTRVWLFTGDLTGTSICISPFTGNNGTFKTSYHYYQVTSNEDNCS